MTADRAFVVAFGLVIGWSNSGHAQSYQPDSRKHAKHPKAAKLPRTRSAHDDADTSMPVVTAVDLRHHKKKKSARQPVDDDAFDATAEDDELDEHDREPRTHAKKNARTRLVDGDELALTASYDEPDVGHHKEKARRPADPVAQAATFALTSVESETPAYADDASPGRTQVKTVPNNPEQATATIVKVTPGSAHRDWQFELGPYLWISDVNASVSLGPASAATSLSFLSFVQHARLGVEALGEVRYRRFVVDGDLMYGDAEFTANPSLGPLTATLTGDTTSLLVDGIAGYALIGGDDSLITLEARAGIRYQRTSVKGQLETLGFTVDTPEFTDSGSDELVGARAILQPRRWFVLSGMADVGVAGASDTTWSACADAGLRVSSHARVTVGWRTLTMVRSRVNLQMSGPRIAVQFTF